MASSGRRERAAASAGRNFACPMPIPSRKRPGCAASMTACSRATSTGSWPNTLRIPVATAICCVAASCRRRSRAAARRSRRESTACRTRAPRAPQRPRACRRPRRNAARGSRCRRPEIVHPRCRLPVIKEKIYDRARPRRRGERPSKRARSRLWRRISTSSSASARRPSRRQDYDRWYEAHAQENIESPGFLNARRFNITPQRGNEGPFEHLARVRVRGHRRSSGARPQRPHRERRHRAAGMVPADHVRRLGLRAGERAAHAGAVGGGDGRARTTRRDPGDPRPDRALRDLLRRQELGRLRRAVDRRRGVRRPRHGVRGQAGRARLPHQLPARTTTTAST